MRSADLCGRLSASYKEKEKLVGQEVLQRVERDIMLQIVDAQWKDHLYSLDHLKEGSGCAVTASAIPWSSTRRRASISSRR